MYDNFSCLVGTTVSSIDESETDVTFKLEDGRTAKLYHEQDCCEDVYVEDITGDLNDLVGTPILLAEESSEDDPNAGESGTWTFYKLATVKGHVTIRFYGSSNGYYSESADFRISK